LFKKILDYNTNHIEATGKRAFNLRKYRW